MRPRSHVLERAVVALVITTVTLKVLAAILPHVLIYLIVLAALVVAVRLVFFHTQRW
jgi:hypothetical protein